MIRIAGILKDTSSHIVKTADRVRNQLHQGINPKEIAALKEFVANSLQNIEKICTEADTSPDKLPLRSRKAYHYLKTLDWNNISPVSNRVEQPVQEVSV